QQDQRANQQTRKNTFAFHFVSPQFFLLPKPQHQPKPQFIIICFYVTQITYAIGAACGFEKGRRTYALIDTLFS
ncbi:MAG: hypothetical protein AB1Z19_04305, partial [Eubacteriales bacterium]